MLKSSFHCFQVPRLRSDGNETILVRIMNHAETSTLYVHEPDPVISRFSIVGAENK